MQNKRKKMFMKREHKTADCQQEKDEAIYMEEKQRY